jgi:hypothetical protein
LPFFAPAVLSKRVASGMLLGFTVEYNKKEIIGPSIIKYAPSEDSIEAIFNAFKYCATTGLPNVSECFINFHPHTISEIEKNDIKVSGDSLSLAVALNLIEFANNLKIKSKIIATGAIRENLDLWSCNKVADLPKKIDLASSMSADIILIPRMSAKIIDSKKSLSRIIQLPKMLPKATSLFESLSLV